MIPSCVSFLANNWIWIESEVMRVFDLSQSQKAVMENLGSTTWNWHLNWVGSVSWDWALNLSAFLGRIRIEFNCRTSRWCPQRTRQLVGMGTSPAHLVARSMENRVTKHSFSLSSHYYLNKSGNISSSVLLRAGVSPRTMPVLEELRSFSKFLAILILL